MKPELVLIDIDNTLVKVGAEQKKAMDSAIKEYFGIGYSDIEEVVKLLQSNRPQDLTVEHPVFHISIAANKVAASDKLQSIYCAYEHYSNLCNARFKSLPGAHEFLKRCQVERVQVIAVTNNFMITAIERLINLGLSNYISDIVTPEVYGIAKPNPFMFQSIVKRFGSSVGKTVMIGDNVFTDGGCQSIGIKYFNITLEDSKQQYRDITNSLFN
jgi:HAD superfamily hydrolase (TIGR01549 family)